MYKIHQHCRACGYGKDINAPGTKSVPQSEKLIEVFDLGVQPLANDFRNEREEHAGYAPLKVMFCPRCTLAQLSAVVKPNILYDNYPYVTSKSTTMQAHFSTLWGEIKKESEAKSLVEIGSNDGDFLMFAINNGAGNVIGIDPARNLADFAVERGLNTICSVFNSDSALSAAMSVPEPDVIVARHVFAHADDWQEFMRGIGDLSGPETLTVIEVPYVVDLLKNTEFDTIYHEHLSYVSVESIKHLLKPTAFHIHKIIHFPIHGGALAIMIRRNDSISPAHESVEQFKENITSETWFEFAKKARDKISDLSAFVLRCYALNKTVCGFGASAKSTVWINACKFTKKHIKFICDCTPYKQYTFSPGSEIPITDEGALLRELPDCAINFAWNFMDAVLANNKAYLDKGGKIISPHLDT